MHVLIVFIIVEVATIYVTTIRVCQASSQMFMFIFFKKKSKLALFLARSMGINVE
jgi:hypothetical protein